eukprot:9322008-Pyramimonas_sp.AAC.1
MRATSVDSGRARLANARAGARMTSARARKENLEARCFPENPQERARNFFSPEHRAAQPFGVAGLRRPRS